MSSNKTIMLTALAALFFFSFFSGAWYGGDDFVHMAVLSEDSSPFAAALHGEVYNRGTKDVNYRPLTNMIMTLIFSRDNVVVARMAIFALHVINGLLVYLILVKLQFKQGLCRFLLAMFLFNPMCNTALFWISAIGDVLCTFFSLLAILLFLGERTTTRAVAIALAYVLGVYSKEMVITLPVLLLVMSMLQNRLSESLRLCFVLLCVGLALFVSRGLIIDTYFAGARTADYFNLSGTLLVSILKYIFSMLVPFPAHSVYEYPVLLLWPILFFGLLFIVFLKADTDRHSSRNFIIAICCVGISLLPVIFKYAPWYLYFVSVFLLLALAYLLNDIFQRPVITLAISAQVLLFVCLTGLWGSWYIDSGRKSRELLEKIHSIPEAEIIIAGLPTRAYTSIGMLSYQRHLEHALQLFHGDGKKVHLVAPATVKNVQTSPIREARAKGFMLDLSEDGYSYFTAQAFALDGIKVSALGSNFLGKPNRVFLEAKTGLPLFFYENGELGRAH